MRSGQSLFRKHCFTKIKPTAMRLGFGDMSFDEMEKSIDILSENVARFI
jgi:hypothetical protein